MTTRSTHSRFALGLATAAVTAAMLATGGLAASAAPADGGTPTPTPTSTATTCSFGEHLVAIWLKLPADLRSDLKDLKAAEPGTERQQEAKDIRDGALAGKYGPRVQRHAETAKDRHIRVIANFPDALKDDLQKLRDADKADKPALAKQIADTALAGGYGDVVQKVAEHAQSAWQGCTD